MSAILDFKISIQMKTMSGKHLLKYPCLLMTPADYFTEWRSQKYPQFHFWQTVLDFEFMILQFMESLRVSDIDLYIASQANLTPSFFALDHTNYARWLPVHVRDMVGLRNRCPGVFREFQRGAFTGPFLPIPSTKLMNKLMHSLRVMVELLQNTQEHFGRWMIAGPEIAHLVKSYWT